MNKPYRMSTRRKLAIATWDSPREGNIYGKITIDMTHALAYLAKINQNSSEKVTVTHLVGRAVGLALKAAPDLNGRIALGRYIPHSTVDASFLIVIPESHDLGKFKICNLDQKNPIQIARELKFAAEQLRNSKDSEFEKSQNLARKLPTWVLRPLLRLIGYLTGALGIEIKALGLEAFPFGAAMITSVGMFGIDEGYAPPTPFARVPICLVITKIKERPVAHEGQVVIRSQLDLMVTVDHRFLDGYRGAQLVKIIREYLENPQSFDQL